MSQVQNTIEASVHATASKVTGAGSATAFVGWATSSNFGMWAGIVIGAGGLIVNWYFKRRADRRAEEAHVALLKKLDSNAPLMVEQSQERVE